MNRQEVTGVFKDIIIACSGLIPSIVIIQPNSHNVLSNGYQIHVRTRASGFDTSCVEDVCDRNNLAFEQANGLIVIYKPKNLKD